MIFGKVLNYPVLGKTRIYLKKKGSVTFERLLNPNLKSVKKALRRTDKRTDRTTVARLSDRWIDGAELNS